MRLQTFLEDVYNAKRLHSLLDYVLPDEFELKYSMGSCLGGMGFLGALHNINCQKNCHSTSHKERCTCSIKARRRCRGNARWVENWSPPFDTFLLCKIRSVHLKIPQGIGSGFSLPFHTSNCQKVIVASIIPYIIPRTARIRSRAETCSSFGGMRIASPLWCCDQLFRRTGDVEWLRRLNPKALAYLCWWLDYRREERGLLCFNYLNLPYPR